ncbi:aminopeptidase P family protein [Niveispirillum irakense]|uniref:aminopeptidase P family protein n=1 Tax=Niveispirillum irakense TaxID=34011 RepID=UPI0004092904|nr:aminopeptidase P family protein [Niveispirillum irakense]
MNAVPSTPATYQGDATLDRLLRDNGVAADVTAIRDLIAGVNAAPDGELPDAWLDLVAARRSPELTEQLLALRATIARPADPAAGDHGARLAALRSELKRLGLDGFVVPRADEYQGEYVPLRGSRLAWISGFTASAGAVVVLLDKAAVFADGRYTIQVRQEVSADYFSYHHLTEEFHGDWAAANLPAGAKLGFDPWMHTAGWAEKMRASLDPAGIALVPTDGNPIDAVWEDQPPPPLGVVNIQPLSVTGRSSADKRTDIAAQLERNRADAAVLTQPDSIAWLLNVRGADVPCTPLPLSFAIIGKDGQVDWFVDARKLAPGLELHLGNGVAIRAPDDLASALDALGAAQAHVRLDGNTAALWVINRLEQAGASVDLGGDPCVLPKAAKNAVEIAGTKAAHQRDGAALVRFLRWFDEEAPKGALDELTVVETLLAYRRGAADFRGPSFDTISGAGPNGAIVHYRVSAKSNRRIEPNSVFLLDSGGQYLDGTTDITRTLAVGDPGAQARRHFTLVLKGHIAINRARFPAGTVGSQLDVLARQFLWQAGLDYDHGTGHGVGSYLSVHEGPQRIAKMPNSVVLLPGMILSNEPGYYLAGSYGIRVENLELVVPLDIPGAERPMLGFEALTLCPIDTRMVDASLLSAEERDWLNAYHARVAAALSPMVEGADLAWLQQATAAI